MLAGRRTGASRCREAEMNSPAAVGAELEAEEAALVHPLHHDRARAVPEEHERRAVVPVEDLRENVAADDERPLREARRPACRRPARWRT